MQIGLAQHNGRLVIYRRVTPSMQNKQTNDEVLKVTHILLQKLHRPLKAADLPPPRDFRKRFPIRCA